MATKCRMIAVMILALAISIAIPAFAGWDIYVTYWGADGWPVYSNGTVCRYDGLTGAYKPGVWHPGQPEEQVKPDALFAESDLNRPAQATMMPDGTIRVLSFAMGGALVFDEYGNGIVQNPSNNPPHQLYSAVYGGATKMVILDNYAYMCGRYLQDSSAGGIAQYELNPVVKPAGPVNPWFAEAPFGVQPLEPSSFTLLPDGRWMCLDGRGHFYWFQSDGTYISKMQTYLFGDPYLESNINDVFVKDGYVYVTLAQTNQVSRWQILEGVDWVVDENWHLTGTLPSNPVGITVGPDGNFYIASWGNDKILKYNSVTGAYIGEFTTVSQYGHQTARITFVETGGTGGGVTGTITLKDWSGATVGVAATIDLRDTFGSTIETKNVTLAADGGYSFTTSLSGNFTAVAKAGHWLAKAMPVSISGGSGSVSFELTNGDCNGDNGVDEIDYALLSNAWYQALGDPAYNPVADLNGDGGVDEIDYAILSNAWYTAGD